ncbi:MAG: resolvase [Geminicoccaceae bacterium]|nr:resolvase [Geminicoccaceae bacterium]
MPKRVALYVRVSTAEQTTENQRRELVAVARHRGWDVVAVYEDQGISGAKGREKRPQFDRMLKDAVRGKFDILAAWAVDRLGRSLHGRGRSEHQENSGAVRRQPREGAAGRRPASGVSGLLDEPLGGGMPNRNAEEEEPGGLGSFSFDEEKFASSLNLSGR